MGKRAIYGEGWIPDENSPTGFDHIYDDEDIDFSFGEAVKRIKIAWNHGKHATSGPLSASALRMADIKAWQDVYRDTYGSYNARQATLSAATRFC